MSVQQRRKAVERSKPTPLDGQARRNMPRKPAILPCGLPCLTPERLYLSETTLSPTDC